MAEKVIIWYSSQKKKIVHTLKNPRTAITFFIFFK
jgi:hypothetical protein